MNFNQIKKLFMILSLTIKKHMKQLFFFISFSLVLAKNALTDDDNYDGSENLIQQNEINWIIDRSNIQSSRGGTTNGPEVNLDLNPSIYFKELSLSQNQKEMDRLAILSMQGEYKVSFEFTELYGADKNYKLDSPYKSWGTEIIIAIENSEDFISLQHIMAMYIKDDNGELKGPFVQKHWRQDWQFEDNYILNYQSDKNWIIDNIQKTRGTWSQSVYQVDDTPRYESFGTWNHKEGSSQWISKKTPRPLPRREFSVRSDYELLSGINKITVMSWGWIMEELNDKLTSDDIFIGSEFGVARYQKIKNFNFEPAYDYWNDTKNYWEAVRLKWKDVLQKNHKICMHEKVNKTSSYIHYFNLAEDYKKNRNIQESRDKIRDITKKFIKKCG